MKGIKKPPMRVPLGGKPRGKPRGKPQGDGWHDEVLTLPRRMAYIVIGVALMIATHVVATTASTRLQRLNPARFAFPSRLLYWALMLAALFYIKWRYGYETTAIVLFAVALGVQSTASDMAAGVVLRSTGAFKVGDYIEIDGVQGTVADLAVYSTRILDDDTGVTVIVPNRKLYEGTITNRTDARLNIVVAEVAVANDNRELVHTALRALEVEVQAVPYVLAQPPVRSNITAVTPAATMLEVRYAMTPDDFQVVGTRSREKEVLTHIHATLVRVGVRLAAAPAAAPTARGPR